MSGINPYDEGTPEWLIYETEGEPDEEPMQFPAMWWLSPTPQQRAEMVAFIDRTQPGLLDDLGIPRG